MYFASIATEFSVFWLIWILGFIGIELFALKAEKGKDIPNYQGSTLSELVWRMTRTNKLVKIIFTLFWVALSYHFFLQK